MVYLFNSKVEGLTESEMKLLYKNNLILCNDYTLEIASIPDWALDEVESILKRKITTARFFKGYRTPRNKIDMSLRNHYDYPRLYDSIINS